MLETIDVNSLKKAEKIVDALKKSRLCWYDVFWGTDGKGVPTKHYKIFYKVEG